MSEEVVRHCNVSPCHLKWCWKLETAEFVRVASERNHGHPFPSTSHIKLGKTSKEMDTNEMAGGNGPFTVYCVRIKAKQFILFIYTQKL